MKLFTPEKIDQKCELIMLFQKKLPKVNNRPIGENSPNLATLVVVCKVTFILEHWFLCPACLNRSLLGQRLALCNPWRPPTPQTTSRPPLRKNKPGTDVMIF
jgi:hypothetical protein